MTNKIKAEIVAHSKRENTGEEIITYKLTFPRIILSEVNTYKMLEKNTSSCLSENSLILVYDGKIFKEVKIKDLFENDNQNLKIVSFNEDYSFLLQNISKVFHSGIKPVYRITFYSGYCLDCTENHRLLKSNEYNNEFVTLKDFNIRQENGNILIDSKIINTYFVGIDSVERRGYSYKNLQVDDSGNIYVSVNNSSSGIKYNEYEIHEPMRITNIEYLGDIDTYDIEADGKYHNFIANGVVVHNSRAIPFEKMVEVVKKEPFIPIAWQLSHKGMQGSEYIDNPYVIERKRSYWLRARDKAISSASELVSSEISSGDYKLNSDGTIEEPKVTLISNSTVTKQLANRLLEPFMWTTQLITGTRESFEHLFEQRCPIYDISNEILRSAASNTKILFKSKKEVIKRFPQLLEKDDLWWLQHNKGQAEIHFMDLAEKMYDALNESVPDELSEDEWHIPFSDRPEFTPEMSLKDKITLSCAMTARTSYTTINDDEILTLEKAENIYNKCKEQGHFSVFSHIAKCMTYEEYESWYKGFMKTSYYFDKNGKQHRVMDSEDFHKVKGYNKNLRGFISLRQYIEDDVELKDI